MLEHGGRLRHAAAESGIPLAEWLDLSTGINPEPYPLPPLPAAVWNRLPEPDDGLLAIAASYYGSEALLPVAGSQAAIQALPRLRPASRVGIVGPTYGEHAHAWRRAGHHVEVLAAAAVSDALDRLDVVVIVNPDNPSGRQLPAAQLLDWHQSLAARGGWLVVDEAFADAHPENCVSRCCPRPGLVVLRSLGKFFGLAGARVGFALAEPPLLTELAEQLGPWPVSGPGRFAAGQALADTAWQQQARARLPRAAARLAALLEKYGLSVATRTALFVWCPHPRAAEIHAALASRGILARRFAEPAGLRLGLPGDESGWRRLETALGEVHARLA